VQGRDPKLSGSFRLALKSVRAIIEQGAGVRVFVTSDSVAGTGVGEVCVAISEQMGVEFKPKTFGSGLGEVVIVLMCRDPAYGFKQRVRHAKAERILYLDVMLDWDEMLRAGPGRQMAVLDAMKRTVREVFAERRISDFWVSRRF
jgi:hypothetical protein